MSDTVPEFFLYGEAPRVSEGGFLHLEPLDARSRPSGWSIRSHRHGDLNHVFFITVGGGVVRTPDEDAPFRAPCLLFIPAGTVHGFVFFQESAGQVLTIASEFLQQRDACRELAEQLWADIHIVPCRSDAPTLYEIFAELTRELAWKAPGHQAAVESWVLQTLVIGLRRYRSTHAKSDGPTPKDEAVLARFREQVELHYRDHWPLPRYAQALGVSLSQLHHICRSSTQMTPHGILQDRLLLEAQRSLRYSDIAVGDIAYKLGFDDPAYFSRFFRKCTGASPRQFRRRSSG